MCMLRTSPLVSPTPVCQVPLLQLAVVFIATSSWPTNSRRRRTCCTSTIPRIEQDSTYTAGSHTTFRIVYRGSSRVSRTRTHTTHAHCLLGLHTTQSAFWLRSSPDMLRRYIDRQLLLHLVREGRNWHEVSHRPQSTVLQDVFMCSRAGARHLARNDTACQLLAALKIIFASVMPGAISGCAGWRVVFAREIDAQRLICTYIRVPLLKPHQCQTSDFSAQPSQPLPWPLPHYLCWLLAAPCPKTSSYNH